MSECTEEVSHANHVLSQSRETTASGATFVAALFAGLRAEVRAAGVIAAPLGLAEALAGYLGGGGGLMPRGVYVRSPETRARLAKHVATVRPKKRCTPEVEARIVALLNEGLTRAEAAARVGLHPNTVHRIIAGYKRRAAATPAPAAAPDPEQIAAALRIAEIVEAVRASGRHTVLR